LLINFEARDHGGATAKCIKFEMIDFSENQKKKE